MKAEKRYWDSNCFLGWLKGEEDKEAACRGVVEAAKKGTIIIVTSALTLTEVIKLKGKSPIPPSDAKIVEEFFKQSYIRVQNVDRFIAEFARKLMWEYKSLKPKDSIHVATALRHHLTIFDTFDTGLIKLDGKLGNPPLRIGNPDYPYQEELFDEEEAQPS